MRKVYYIYNPKTRTYDRVYPTFRQRAFSYARRLFVGMGLGAGCFILLLILFGSPSEKDLRIENSRLRAQYDILYSQLDEALNVMKQLQQRDDNLYRVIMQAEPVNEKLRNANYAKTNRYEELMDMANAKLVVKTTQQMDLLKRQLYIQSKSYDEDGTTLLVSLGCVQDRRCHCDTCPVGIATQNECLRRHFTGKSEYIVNFLRLLAEDVREHLSRLGLHSLEEAVGRTDLLELNAALDQAAGFDFSRILAQEKGATLHYVPDANPYIFDDYDRRELLPNIDFAALEKEPISLDRAIRNVNRTVGTELSGEIVSRFGAAGLADESVRINFRGTAGQSFGAFLTKGITFTLDGEANDFVGKGLSGGIIAIRPAIHPSMYEATGFRPEDNVIAGNVIAYGGTSGKIFLNGQAGERFGIRNSGVTLVAEGIGDHGCEYMTGGQVVVLGSTGVNFGAGMTGGVAYVMDENGDFDLRCNLDSIDLATIEPESDDERGLRELVFEHYKRTESPLAKRILGNWSSYRPRFVKVVPVKEN